MPFATTPLSPAVIEAVRKAWGIRPEDVPGDAWNRAVRLHGGEESAAYRVRHLVVRIGPPHRSTEESEWCHAVARRATTGGVAETVTPLPTRHGTTVVRIGGRPVSVWPYVSGDRLDRDDPAQRTAAARLLGRLHRALLAAAPHTPPRPVPSLLEPGLYGEPWPGHPDLADPDLDRWLSAFHGHNPLVQPLHGDYYRANLLTRRGRITAVLDWDEALLGPPALELATAAREFSDPWTTDLRQAREFAAEYAEADGTAGHLDDEALAQLVRHRLRCEASWYEEHVATEGRATPEDVEYHRRRRELFRALRP